MPRVFHVVGLSAAELDGVKLTVKLLRHPDPAVGELCRQALDYVDSAAVRMEKRDAGPEARQAG